MSQDILEDVSEQRKIYTRYAIIIGTVVGGVIAAAYMMIINFSAFGQRRMKTITIAAAVLLLLFNVFSVYIPFLSAIPDFGYIIFNTIIVIAAVHFLQTKSISMHQENGRPVFGGWNIFLVIIISVAALLSLFLGFYFFVTTQQNEGALFH